MTDEFKEYQSHVYHLSDTFTVIGCGGVAIDPDNKHLGEQPLISFELTNSSGGANVFHMTRQNVIDLVDNLLQALADSMDSEHREQA